MNVTKQEADAHDRLVDAAMELADLILAAGISIDECDLEELTFFLAKNVASLRAILGPLKNGPITRRPEEGAELRTARPLEEKKEPVDILVPGSLSMAASKRLN